MKQMIIKWEKFFLINLAVAVFTFFTTISLKQINHLDGIWHSSFSQAGNWERGAGRWVWPYIDKPRLILLDRDDVKAMPMFPRKGSITNIDGITVVKISNRY